MDDTRGQYYLNLHVADRPGVGSNLQDHLEFYFQIACKQPVSLYPYMNWFAKGLIGAQWLFTGKGLGASNQFEACAFIRSKAGVEYPDIQYHFLPIAVRYDGKAAAGGHGFQAHVGPMRSKSRGAVTLRSGDPKDAPKILFNYMSDASDWEDFRTCIRLTREIFGQEAMAGFVKHEIQPGAGVQTDAQLDDFIREHVESAYHPCGTARIGRRDDPMAVVDPECRVIGVEGLRVADSSIFPQVTNGNLNGPSIMTGEKAADHILGLPPLTQYDAGATPMFNSFKEELTSVPYNLLQPKVDLNATNTPNSPGAKVSATMDFDEYDEAPEDELNRILWAEAKGPDAPYPTPIHRVLFTESISGGGTSD